ncbi:hypothetical protein B0T10DRAFT_484892 [Thelonectria olida]|uniref:Secreted protein n=1 Tax=Thelonectria olida TaxID=1576542 RepID=A0A9P8W5G1_9HYPO|nr:hypothetical protein B0T10DRAFT_484892 [Thelonectria olida]
MPCIPLFLFFFSLFCLFFSPVFPNHPCCPPLPHQVPSACIRCSANNSGTIQPLCGMTSKGTDWDSPDTYLMGVYPRRKVW